MQQRLTVVWLGLCALLLSLNLGVQWWNSSSPAHGASAQNDELLVVASNSQDAAFCFVYNKTQDLLVAYRQRQTGGLQLMGIRNTAFDFPRIDELPRSAGSDTSVDQMKQLEAELKERAKARAERKRGKKSRGRK